MWECKACSYRNLNSTAKQCHVCQTARITGTALSSSQQAVIDLTDFSPKRHAGSMESNRRRRRRLDGGLETNECTSGQENKDDASNNDLVRPKLRQHHAAFAENGTHSGGIQSNRATESKSQIATSSSNKMPEVLEILSSDDDDEIIADPGQRSLPLNHGKDEQSKKPSQCNTKPPKSRESTKMPYKSTQEKKSIDDKMVSDYQTLASSESSHEQQQSSTNSTVSKRIDTKKTTSNSKQDKPKSIADYYNNNINKQTSQPIETLMKQAISTLKQRFGHSSLRPLQEKAIRRALQRTHQIIIMATGGGKSICYQLPALIGHGQVKSKHQHHDCVTIVVCPLIALMVDQVRNLQKKGIMTAACLSSSQTAKEKTEIYSRLRYDKKTNKGNKAKSVTAAAESTPVQLLYVTPELITTDKFRDVLNKLYESNRLFQIAVDEAHCVSTWGHDFRKAYKELSWLREAFPDVPVMACTGTATAKVISDIRSILRLDVDSAPCIMGTFNRTNISYEVRFKDSLDATSTDGALMDLTKVVKQQHEIANKANEPCNGIVYVFRRQDCAFLASRISKITGLVCKPYHAGLKDSEREDIQCKWTDGTVSLCVATVAFGMGIDLGHVRYVIHWTVAKSLEGFYQESGRGGRDGKPSVSILYYSKDDAEKLAYVTQKSSEISAQKRKGNIPDGVRPQKADHAMVELEGMIDYCTKPGCRRKHVLEHFGEEFDATTQCRKTCDFCKNPEKVEADTRAAECMSAVINSRRAKPKQDEKKFHHNPLESDESLDGYESDGFHGAYDELLDSAEYAGNEKFAAATGPQKTNGFVKASSVLGKYEKMECQEGKKGGFVNFKTRTFNDDNECIERKQRPIEIPAHLRGNMPDPHASSYKKATQEKASKAPSSDEIKAELEELKRTREAKREAMLKSLGGNSQATSSLPVPSLYFKKRR